MAPAKKGIVSSQAENCPSIRTLPSKVPQRAPALSLTSGYRLPASPGNWRQKPDRRSDHALADSDPAGRPEFRAALISAGRSLRRYLLRFFALWFIQMF